MLVWIGNCLQSWTYFKLCCLDRKLLIVVNIFQTMLLFSHAAAIIVEREWSLFHSTEKPCLLSLFTFVGTHLTTKKGRGPFWSVWHWLDFVISLSTPRAKGAAWLITVFLFNTHFISGFKVFWTTTYPYHIKESIANVSLKPVLKKQQTNKQINKKQKGKTTNNNNSYNNNNKNTHESLNIITDKI